MSGRQLDLAQVGQREAIQRVARMQLAKGFQCRARLEMIAEQVGCFSQSEAGLARVTMLRGLIEEAGEHVACLAMLPHLDERLAAEELGIVDAGMLGVALEEHRKLIGGQLPTAARIVRGGDRELVVARRS